MQRGEIWWARLPEPAGSGPGYRRPVVIVQADEFNRSRIRTVIAAAVTSKIRLAEAAAPPMPLPDYRSDRAGRTVFAVPAFTAAHVARG